MHALFKSSLIHVVGTLGILVLHASSQTTARLSQSIRSGPAITVAPSASESVTSHRSPPTPTAVGVSFPPVGSIPQDFSSKGLERLWDIVKSSIGATFMSIHFLSHRLGRLKLLHLRRQGSRSCLFPFLQLLPLCIPLGLRRHLLIYCLI